MSGKAKKLDEESFNSVREALNELISNDVCNHYRARAAQKMAEGDVGGSILVTQTMLKMEELAEVLSNLPY
jgi:RNA binding exosome subunit